MNVVATTETTEDMAVTRARAVLPIPDTTNWTTLETSCSQLTSASAL